LSAGGRCGLPQPGLIDSAAETPTPLRGKRKPNLIERTNGMIQVKAPRPPAARRKPRPKRRDHPGVIGFIGLAIALTLAGCATSDGPTSVASTSTVTGEASVTDAETCAAISEVVTIRFNADVAVRQDRMTVQEQRGWYRLSTLVLDRVPTREEGAVSEGVAALQAAAPPVALTAPGTTQMESDEWDAALTMVIQSCTSAGSEVATTSFTGG
jgi:hypothetical protein